METVVFFQTDPGCWQIPFPSHVTPFNLVVIRLGVPTSLKYPRLCILMIKEPRRLKSRLSFCLDSEEDHVEDDIPTVGARLKRDPGRWKAYSNVFLVT